MTIRMIFTLLFMISTTYSRADHRDTSVITGNEIREQFFPNTPLAPRYHFEFDYPFHEFELQTKEDKNLYYLLFPAAETKGVILYLHGSNGAANVWGKIAPIYTEIDYDFCLFDYRGYGKSEGRVENEEQLFSDVQLMYDTLKARYGEDKIVIIGQSIGSGAASYLGAHNEPKMVFLQAPYYSIEDWLHQLVPTLKVVNNPFKFETYKYLTKIKSPLVLIHGDADDAVYYSSSKKLAKLMKPTDQFITLSGEGHNDFTKNMRYLEWIKILLK